MSGAELRTLQHMVAALRSPNSKTIPYKKIADSKQTVWHSQDDELKPIFSCSIREIESTKLDLTRLVKLWTIEPPKTYGLTETAQRTGLKIHDIINIVKREKIIEPETDGRGFRFKDHDVELLTLIGTLKQKGFRLPLIRQIVANPDSYIDAGDKVAEAMSEWLAERNQEHYDAMIEAIAELPLLDEDEAIVYRLNNQGIDLEECALQAGLASDVEARRVLDSAYSKIGRLFPVLMQLQF